MTLNEEEFWLQQGIRIHEQIARKLLKRLRRVTLRIANRWTVTSHLAKFEPPYRETALAQLLGRPPRRRRWYAPRPVQAVEGDHCE